MEYLIYFLPYLVVLLLALAFLSSTYDLTQTHAIKGLLARLGGFELFLLIVYENLLLLMTLILQMMTKL